jgi:hypothetical protein
VIFPSMSSAIDWVMLSKQRLTCPVTLRVPLIGSADHNKDVHICVETEKTLHRFLCVLLLQFSDFNGLHIGRLGPGFRKLLDSHTNTSEPALYNLLRSPRLRKNECID